MVGERCGSGRQRSRRAPEIGIQYLVLPTLALALPQAAAVARLLRSAMDQARGEEYV